MSQLSTRFVAAFFAVGLGAAPVTAFADLDAGTAPPEDATASSDAASSVDAASDATGSDAVSTPDTISQTDAGIGDTGTADTGTVDSGPTSFNENPCWDDKCAKETAACKADKVCAAYAACKGNADCQKKVVTSQAIQDALNKILGPLQDCGWKSCNDPKGGTCKGSCGKYLGPSAKCNCDDACKQYNDCCADKEAVCGAGTCKGACGKVGNWADGTPMPQQGGCFCDDECAANGDCCDDIEKECPGTSGGGDTTTAADGGACKPACTGKNCGDDDGCGGTCPGTCPGGGICFTDSATGKKACKTSGTADVPTAGGDGAATDSATAGSGDSAGTLTDAGADAAKPGTTGTTNNNNTSSSSGGMCATSTRPAGSGWIVAMFAVGLAIALRRKFA